MIRLLCATWLAASMVPTAGAQPATDEEALALSDMARMAAQMKGGESKNDSPYPPFEKVTEGMEAQKGLFTLWSYPASAKDKDTEKLLAQIPAGFLGEKFMLSMSFSGGGFFTGFPLQEHVVQWEEHDGQLLLIEPETLYVINDSDEVSDVVKRTYPERIRAAVPIVTKSPSGDPVIDLGNMLKSNFAGIAAMSMGPFGGARGGGINAKLSEWTKKKAFELNVEIGAALAVNRPFPPGSYDKKMVHYSFWKLPKTDYKPRIADDRIGYFLTAHVDWSKPTDARELFNRYINRWHLEKRDPSLDLCEPKQPIVFYIEKTVPVRFRRAVRDGILEWNKAFEKIGFSNAIQVRQQTDDNEWKDLDPEDMRYSFFRWIVTGAGFAMGPSRANPFTGQIYDADIIMDDSMVRFFELSAKRNLPEAILAMKTQDPFVKDFLKANPQWKRPERPWETFRFGDQDDEELAEAVRRRMRQNGHVLCTYAEGMKHEMALAATVLAGAPQEVVEEFLYEAIKEVVSHEVGHTLGLRHNFKASTIYTLDEIKKRRETGEATCGSVMDYNPLLFLPEETFEGHFITPTIGPYDYWAIEYGYRPTGTYEPPTPTETEEGDGDKDDTTVAAGTNGADDAADEIPEELLKKLPPHVRKMVESGALKKRAGNGGSKKSGPAFKKPPSGEEAMLQAIASRATEPELAYATDEDTTAFGPDPRTNRYDMGADPVDWARARMELVNKRLDNILDWAVKEDEPWYFLRGAFTSLMFEKVRVLDFVGKYIGGQYTSRAHRGDPNAPPPFELVEADRQRAALEFIEENLYTDDFFAVSPDVLNHLTVPRWYHAGTNISVVVDFPYHDFVAVMQWFNLFDRLFPNTIRRIYDAQAKTAAKDKLTAAEYIQRIRDACWKNAVDRGAIKRGDWSDTRPFIPSVRRSLQREYLNLVEPLVRTRPGVVLPPDLHAMMQYSLRELAAQIEVAMGVDGLDFASKAHLASCKSRIERMLKPELEEYDG